MQGTVVKTSLVHRHAYTLFTLLNDASVTHMHPFWTHSHAHRLPAWHSTPCWPWRDIRMSGNWSSNEKKSHLSFMILVTLTVRHHMPKKTKNPFQRKFTNLLTKPALESTWIQFGTFSLLMNDPCCSSTDPQFNILMEKSVFTPFFPYDDWGKKWTWMNWESSPKKVRWGDNTDKSRVLESPQEWRVKHW